MPPSLSSFTSFCAADSLPPASSPSVSFCTAGSLFPSFSSCAGSAFGSACAIDPPRDHQDAAVFTSVPFSPPKTSVSVEGCSSSSLSVSFCAAASLVPSFPPCADSSVASACAGDPPRDHQDAFFTSVPFSSSSSAVLFCSIFLSASAGELLSSSLFVSFCAVDSLLPSFRRLGRCVCLRWGQTMGPPRCSFHLGSLFLTKDEHFRRRLFILVFLRLLLRR